MFLYTGRMTYESFDELRQAINPVVDDFIEPLTFPGFCELLLELCQNIYHEYFLDNGATVFMT
jgi:hypothetical protein